jgi:sodium-dependent phosphate transporter
MYYVWIVAVGGISAFAMSCGIGSNDLANAFGTAYGSGVMTLKQIVIVASFCEFGGAFLLGGEVTKTIAGSVTNISMFTAQPAILMYGMLSALIAATVWLFSATYMELAVSTTHSIIGGIIGFAMAYNGPQAITWIEPLDEFPYMKGVVPIVVSWFTSPILSAGFSALIFWLTRTLILRSNNSLQRSYHLLPVLTCITFGINSYFILVKGSKNKISWTPATSAWISACIGAGAGLVGLACIPWLRKNVEASHSQTINDVSVEVARSQVILNKKNTDDLAMIQLEAPELLQVPEDVDPFTNIEVFDPKTEASFKYLQIFTSMCESFAHGANDVSNSIGPLAAIWSVHQTLQVKSKVDVPMWMLALGGTGIIVGLATNGIKILRVLGLKMTKITPTRGYAAELSTSLVVAIASSYGLPISTTHCITGAVIGVGLLEGGNAVNWQLAGKTFSAWIFTLIITALLSAALFSQGIHAPSVK